LSPLDQHLRSHRDAWLADLAELERRGRRMVEAPAADLIDPVDHVRTWQHECAALVNRLSGGSKAHWLARAFSGAFLVRPPGGGVVVEATRAEIVGRLLDVLAQARTSLSSMDENAAASSGPAPTRRFEFVRNAALRPVLERAFLDSGDALARGEHGLALILSCSVIEAIVTDALDGAGIRAPGGRAEDWSFGERIAVAEGAGLIHRGCARLPAAARTYRDLTDENGELVAGAAISERDARIAGEVVRVVMRDLDPGR
jgi:hypothetical protein